ncbi:hypothetical protein JQ615_38405 [Bradyrhizobium jicamae]|uniref:Uncharacterized protein n=1 Tax=Bradyrhizobium jicamae TaxID=280332 RepID=A0ABS5FYC1_9BRAD|nr:hypothetical protein [Bradyrhizobium jicamae]MBR0801241.1 hypothetical protein [Bradyrhizobium jicamae]
MILVEGLSLEESLRKIGDKGFRWEDFPEIFPFGFLGRSEGQYAKLVDAALESLPNDTERAVLLDLLDAQWCVYIEQLWITHEVGGNQQRLVGRNHLALARLQMSNNIRSAWGFPEKDGRSAMMEIGPSETLMDRIEGASPLGRGHGSTVQPSRITQLSELQPKQEEQLTDPPQWDPEEEGRLEQEAYQKHRQRQRGGPEPMILLDQNPAPKSAPQHPDQPEQKPEWMSQEDWEDHLEEVKAGQKRIWRESGGRLGD